MVIDLLLSVRQCFKCFRVLPHLIYTITSQGRHFNCSLLFRWINKVWKHLSKVTNLAMPRWELTFKLLTPDLIIGLNFEVFLFSPKLDSTASLISFQRTFFLFELVWVCLCSLHPNIPSDPGFLSPPHNRSVSLNIHLWNVLLPNSTLKPWLSGIYGSLVCSLPSCHIGRS